jgi:hypothetical protein
VTERDCRKRGHHNAQRTETIISEIRDAHGRATWTRQKIRIEIRCLDCGVLMHISEQDRPA